jgi:hypothetical protein
MDRGKPNHDLTRGTVPRRNPLSQRRQFLPWTAIAWHHLTNTSRNDDFHLARQDVRPP